MYFTDYGLGLAKSEPMPKPHPLGGATAHMAATQYDAGKRVLLTGKGIRREAKSVYGAYATAVAMYGVERAWHVREDGTRRLVFSR